MGQQVNLEVYDNNGKYVRTVAVAPKTAKRLASENPVNYKIAADMPSEVQIIDIQPKKPASPAADDSPSAEGQKVEATVIELDKEQIQEEPEQETQAEPEEKAKKPRAKKTSTKKTRKKKSEK